MVKLQKSPRTNNITLLHHLKNLRSVMIKKMMKKKKLIDHKIIKKYMKKLTPYTNVHLLLKNPMRRISIVLIISRNELSDWNKISKRKSININRRAWERNAHRQPSSKIMARILKIAHHRPSLKRWRRRTYPSPKRTTNPNSIKSPKNRRKKLQR